MQVCTSLQTDNHSVFYRPDALPAAQPTASKHWKHSLIKKKPKNYTQEEWVSKESLILASRLLRPMSRNSVLEEFSVWRFAVIQDEIWSRALWRWCWSRSESEGRKERAECHLRRGDGLGNKRTWGYWEEWCTWRRAVDQRQSLVAISSPPTNYS